MAYQILWEKNINPPNLEKLQELIQKSRSVIQKMDEPYSWSPTDFQQRNKTTDEPTEPIIGFSSPQIELIIIKYYVNFVNFEVF